MGGEELRGDGVVCEWWEQSPPQFSGKLRSESARTPGNSGQNPTALWVVAGVWNILYLLEHVLGQGTRSPHALAGLCSQENLRCAACVCHLQVGCSGTYLLTSGPCEPPS